MPTTDLVRLYRHMRGELVRKVKQKKEPSLLDRAFPGWSETKDAKVPVLAMGGSDHSDEEAELRRRLVNDLYT